MFFSCFVIQDCSDKNVKQLVVDLMLHRRNWKSSFRATVLSKAESDRLIKWSIIPVCKTFLLHINCSCHAFTPNIRKSHLWYNKSRKGESIFLSSWCENHYLLLYIPYIYMSLKHEYRKLRSTKSWNRGFT